MTNRLGLSPIKRTALVVSDLDAAVAFYQDVLSMQYLRGGPVDDPTVFQQLGLTRGLARFAVMKSSEDAPEVGMLSFLEIKDPPPDKVTGMTGPVRRGEAIVVMHAQNIDPIHERLTDWQAEVVCPPISFTPPGGPPQREITFRDPDGYLICVIERP